jgi:hypothetical protein
VNSFAREPAESRADFIYQYAATAQVPAYIVEKDFWVCWLLGRIFSTDRLGRDCVFKGGTSLAKVFNAIHRFSEDIDLGLSPQSLGWKEADLDEAPSKTARLKRVAQIEADCAHAVRENFLPTLEKVILDELGPPTSAAWLNYELEATSRSPIILFSYPKAVPAGIYIAPTVKIEFGSLTDQRPTGTHPITPMVATLAPAAFADFRSEVVALEIERTFWEKATILHAEYHRPESQPLRDRYARHYADFASLWHHPHGPAAAARLDLLDRVRLHKSRFFASGWSHFETAKPGSMRLVPPKWRIRELRKDYTSMKPMFLVPPPSFEDVLSTLHQAEKSMNRT